jgi:arginine-tRNA-protein transferase
MPPVMRVALYEINNGECPYLPNRTWVTKAFRADRMPEELYEYLLNEGWRRSGVIFYKNRCPGCSLCIPIRVPAERFAPSKSQRKILRKNRDLTIRRYPTGPSEEILALYRKYHQARHDPDEEVSETTYMSFLGRSPIHTDIMEYRLGHTLVGAGWIDVLPEGLSTVYFIFDPDYGHRSLGTFSAMKEIELCRELGKPWYYLGFYVPGSSKMEYKARFRPYQLLLDESWHEFEG